MRRNMLPSSELERIRLVRMLKDQGLWMPHYDLHKMVNKIHIRAHQKYKRSVGHGVAFLRMRLGNTNYYASPKTRLRR